MSVVQPAFARRFDTPSSRLSRSTALATLILLCAGVIPASAQTIIDADQELPAGEVFNVGEDLIVGNTATATLTQVEGGSITNNQGILGQNSGAFGTVTLDGGTWSNTNLFVGYGGRGHVNVNDGDITAISLFIAGLGSGSGEIEIDAGGSAAVSGSIFVGERGNGLLNIRNGGTSTANTGTIGRYTENGIAGTGTVIVDGTGSSWTLADNLYIGRAGDGTLVLSNGGKTAVTAGTATVADQAGSRGLIVFGAEEGEAAATTGELDVATVQFGAGDGGVLFNHTGSASYGFAFKGDGDIDHLLGDTTLAGASVDFTGTTTVRGGSLIVDGELQGTTTVNAGRLAGTGTLGTVIANDGGTIDPGDSATPMTVDHITFNEGSSFAIAINDQGDNDALTATTAAVLNGGYVVLDVAPGTYLPSTQYTILTSASVTGDFDGVDEDFAFLTASLDHSATEVVLTLDVDFEGAGETPNEIATAAALDALGVDSPYYEALLGLSNDEGRDALNQLSGEGFASVSAAFLEDSRFIRDAGLGGARNFWAQVYGGFASLDGDGNASGLDSRSGGLAVGADGPISGDWYAGILAAAGTTQIEARSMQANSTDLSIGVYGGGAAGPIDVKLGAAYTHHLIETTRSVVFADIDDTMSADYAAGTTQGFVEISHSVDLGGATLVPFAQLAAISQTSGGGSETGGEGALEFSPVTSNALLMTLGIGVAHDFQMTDGGTANLAARVGWRHAAADQPLTDNSFDGGDAFSIAGTPLANDALVLEGGAKFDLNSGLSLGMDYSGQYSAETAAHGARLTLSGSF